MVDNHTGVVIELFLDFLQGTGHLEMTILFSGFYPADISNSSYMISLAYILTVTVVYLVSLLYIVYYVAKFLRKSPGRTSKYGMTFSNIIFSGWDHSVSELDAVKIGHRLLVCEVKASFDDEDFKQRKLRQTRNDLVKLYLVRFLINLIIVTLIVGGFAGIYFLVKKAEENLEIGGFQKYLWQYAPTIVVSGLNLVYPILFNFLVQFEHYRGRTELLLTLFRCVTLRLTSLAILIITKVFFIVDQERTCDPYDQNYICWETHLGQQIYSVMILDFLIQIGMTFVVNVARKLLGKFDNSLCKMVSNIEFYVPGHVLDVVYVQTICWLSIIYAPLMAVACFFYFCILFGLKFFTVSWTCVPADRVFRASRSSAMFMTILSVAFFICAIPNGLAILYLCPSIACSPFRGLGNSWEAFVHYVCQLSGSAYWIR